jgi:hypothetical protein
METTYPLGCELLCMKNIVIEWRLLKNIMVPDEYEGFLGQSRISMECEDGGKSEYS